MQQPGYHTQSWKDRDIQAIQQQQEAQMDIRVQQRILSAFLEKQLLAAAGPLALAQV